VLTSLDDRDLGKILFLRRFAVHLDPLQLPSPVVSQ
jgi:hypothetical protein